MTCKELTQLIEMLKKELNDFKFYSNINSLPEMKQVKTEIDIITREFEKSFPPLAKDFLKAIDNPIFLEYLAQDDDGTLVHAESGLGNYSNFPIQTWDYRNFLKLLPEFLSKKQIKDQKWAMAYLNKLFLQNYNWRSSQSHRLSVNFNDLPDLLRTNFGYNLNQGKLKIDHLRGDAFMIMNGGDVDVGKFDMVGTDYSELGKEMTDGTIHIQQLIHGNVGSKIYGGTISVEQMENGHIAPEGRAGTIFVKHHEMGNSTNEDAVVGFGATGGTYLIGEIPPQKQLMIGVKENATVVVKCKSSQIKNSPKDPPYSGFNGSIICYDEGMDKFVDMGHSNSIFRSKTSEEQKGWLNTTFYVTYMERGVVILDYELPELLDYKFFENGVLVLKNPPQKDIGKGMRGGIIIIDNQKITLEECRERISHERQHGIILYMRRYKEGKGLFKKKKVEFMEVR